MADPLTPDGSATTHLHPAARPVARLEPPRATGTTAGALLHCTGALAVAVAMLTEPAADYRIPLWAGVAQMASPAADVVGVSGLHLWALVALVASTAGLAGLGRAWTAWPVGVLTVLWAGLGGAAVWVGARVDGAALPGGIAFLMIALGAWRIVGALGRPRAPRPPRGQQ